jgi:hypothetical protein
MYNPGSKGVVTAICGCTIRGANQGVMEAVLKRAEKDAKDPVAADLLPKPTPTLFDDLKISGK